MRKLMGFCLTALQWLFSLIIGGVIFVSLLAGAFVTAIIAILSFVVVFPPVQKWIDPKLPFLQPKGRKLFIALIVLIVAPMLSPSLTQVEVCQAPVEGECPSHEASLNVDQVQTAYVVASLPKNPKTKEALLKLNYTSDNAGEQAKPVYTATQALGTQKDGSLEFKLPLNELPIGQYKTEITIGDNSMTGEFELTGNPPQFNAVALCGKLNQDNCDGNYNLYTENSFPTLHLNAEPQHFRQETPIEITLNYISEPEKITKLQTVSGTVKPQDKTFKAKIPLPSFKVGTYEVNIASPAQDFLSQTETIKVWHNNQAIDARAERNLSDSTKQISELKLCEKVLSPEEIAQIKENSENETETKIDNRQRCLTDGSTFPRKIQTLAADVTIGLGSTDSGENLDLTIIWRYLQGPSGGSQELKSKTVSIEPNLSGFTYSLTYDGGYPAGTYDVIAFLGTNDAKPIRRQFVVE